MMKPTCNCAGDDVTFFDDVVVGEQHCTLIPNRRMISSKTNGIAISSVWRGEAGMVEQHNRPLKLSLLFCPLCGKPFEYEKEEPHGTLWI